MFWFYAYMEISFREKNNILSLRPICQNSAKGRCYATNELKNDVFVKNKIAFGSINSDTILWGFNKFGLKEYKSLAPEQIEIIRKGLSEELIQDTEAAMTFAKMMKSGLKKEFEQAPILMFFDRNLSPISKIFEYTGEKVVYSPIKMPTETMGTSATECIENLSSEEISKYAQYLGKNGVSEQEAKNSGRHYVLIVDDISSEKHFKKLFERPEIGLKSDKIHYKSLSDFILNDENIFDFKNHIMVGDKGMMKFDFLREYSLNKKFSANYYPHSDVIDVGNLDKIESLMSRPESMECKRMQFSLIDKLNELGLLKE